MFTLFYDSDVNLTQVKHNGKAITAAYVTTLSETTKTTVAEVVVAFSWVFTEEVLNALLVAPTTTGRQQALRLIEPNNPLVSTTKNTVNREQARFLIFIPRIAWAVGFAITGAWGTWMSMNPNEESKPFVRPPAIEYPDNCNELCKKRIVEASNQYWKLTQKRMAQYQTGGTNGRDLGHAQAVLQLQRGLKKSISAVRYHCTILPPQLPEWERAANEPLPE